MVPGPRCFGESGLHPGRWLHSDSGMGRDQAGLLERVTRSSLLAEFVTEMLDIHGEMPLHQLPSARVVVLRVVLRLLRTAVVVRQRHVTQPEPTRHVAPVLFDVFELADEVGEHAAAWVDEPVELIAVRYGVQASATAVFSPFDEIIERHALLRGLTIPAFVQ